MKTTEIYQTLEDRQNYEEVEQHGPYFCSVTYPNGILKKGSKQPWLGSGYYFWDTRICDAHWWGNNVYNRNGYIICHTTYDQHSPLLYDLVGNVDQFDEFIKCADLIKEKRNLSRVSFPVVLKYLKKTGNFNFSAIRVWPHPDYLNKTSVLFPDNKLFLGKAQKIQICFFDKQLLINPYKIVYRKNSAAEQTI